MAETITAVYENRVLRPLSPLNLRESQTVRIQIMPEKPLEDEEEIAIHMLVADGLLTPPPRCSDVEPLSDDERWELADRMGQTPGRPLSEIIIEDRGEW